jgi:hypothetical protein
MMNANKIVRDRCGFNFVTSLKVGASFYAHQTCLFEAKDAISMARVLVSNLKKEGWEVTKVTSGVKKHPGCDRWSVQWVRVRATPPKNYKPSCGICGRKHTFSRDC